MLITPEYIELNRMLHAEREDYGSRERLGRWNDILRNTLDGERILDYGCGKGAMQAHMGAAIVTNYDPATFPVCPHPHPVVACLDVLEHVEPECLNDVLAHIASLTQRVAYFVISKSLGNKTLPDGRPAHLIVKDAGWWHSELCEHFSDVQYVASPLDKTNEMTFICSHS